VAQHAPSDEDDARENDDEVEEEGAEGHLIVKGEMQDDDQALLAQTAPVDMRKQARGRDGYLPGSIVRVRLKNFVTYDAVEFSPGPHLNMIVGPNGTGKSTIVCAVALGLGWTPAVLGRAKEVASFVKQGAEESEIEIELKTLQEGKPNPVIRRHLARSDNRSDWFLNGKKVTAKDIREQVDKFGIDVSNLCCFLPQDRVAEFAQMGSAELLRQTQKAAGQPGMTEWHDKLIEQGDLQIKLTSDLNEQQIVLADLEDSLGAIQRDVQRAEERQQLELQVQALGLRVLRAKFNDRRAHFHQLREQKTKAKEQLRKLQDRLKPLADKLAEVEKQHSQLADSGKRLRNDLAREGPTVKRLLDSLERHEAQSQEVFEKLDSVKRREKDTQRLIATLRRSIADLESIAHNEPDKPDTVSVDRQIRNIRETIRMLDAENEEAQDNLNEHVTEVRDLDRELNDQRRQLDELDNIKHNRLMILQKADNDTFRAVEWLRKNSGVFKEKVYEPVMLELSIKDQRWASAVESCINWAMMRTFVCQNEEDYDTFGRQMDRLHLRVNFCDRGRAKALQDFLPPVSMDDLISMGFDNYVIGLVEGPDIILRYLCADAGLHTIPIAASSHSVDVAAMERLRKFRRYITGQQQHTVTYAQYGTQAVSTLTRNLRRARTFVQSVDQQKRHSLDTRIREINGRKAELEDLSRQITAQRDARSERKEQAAKEFHALEVSRADRLREYQEWERAKVNLQTKRNALKAEERKPTAAAETEKLREQLDRAHDKCQKALDEIVKALEEQVERRSQYDIHQLDTLRFQQRVDALKRLKIQHESQFDDSRQALATINEELQRSKDGAASILNNLRAAHDHAGQAAKDLFQETENDPGTAEQLEDMYNASKAQLEMAIGIDPGVLQDYERRKRQRDALEERIGELQRSKSKIDERVKKYRDKWVPALEELVGNVNKLFSKAFAAIGNAGEIQIARAERYDMWGIDILVKFRNAEELQKLNAHRQSGGERSISTITYLLSLTEMSRAPFSLVDEINQGMDQKYERQVHDHMVKVTCEGASAGQYFLITPKLLPNLEYHDRMRVLIINNGDWLPERFSFTDYLNKRAKSGMTNGRAIRA
jgi:chromosome segregation ATPase